MPRRAKCNISHERTGIAKSEKKKKNVNQGKKQAVIRNWSVHQEEGIEPMISGDIKPHIKESDQFCETHISLFLFIYYFCVCVCVSPGFATADIGHNLHSLFICKT